MNRKKNWKIRKQLLSYCWKTEASDTEHVSSVYILCWIILQVSYQQIFKWWVKQASAVLTYKRFLVGIFRLTVKDINIISKMMKKKIRLNPKHTVPWAVFTQQFAVPLKHFACVQIKPLLNYESVCTILREKTLNERRGQAGIVSAWCLYYILLKIAVSQSAPTLCENVLFKLDATEIVLLSCVVAI